jgi:DNA-binding NtrC family response regulator
MTTIDALLSGGATLEEIEESIIRAALERHRGKLAPAARDLGLRRGQMQYRVAKLREHDMSKA